MIYLLIGNDRKTSSSYIKKIGIDNGVIRISSKEITQGLINDYANNQSLFGKVNTIIIENIFSESDVIFSRKDLEVLKDSKTVFIFLEDKMLCSEVKKYSKYATIEHFEEKKVSQTSKFNIFSIADAFGRGDKIGTWVLYNKAIEMGIEPEPISGILFWKVKSMILNGTRVFSVKDLRAQSSRIVSLYHLAHRGECDMTIGLEQFILSSLVK